MSATIVNWNEIDREIAADEAYRRFRASRPASAIIRANLAHVPNATYTVVMDASEADWDTVRIRPWKSRADGSRVLAMLVGPDNGTDYVGVGTIHPDGTVSLWSDYRGNRRIEGVVARLAASSAEDHDAMRHGYALLSGRCARCGRVLTVPASLHRGVGPECAGVLNPSKRRTPAPAAPDTGDCPF